MIHGKVSEIGERNRSNVKSILYRLRVFVQQHLQGKENAMKSGAIMNRLGFHAGGTNQKMRMAAKLLLREEQIPIISGPDGFYVAKTVEEMNEYLHNLEARRKGLEESEAAVREIRDKWIKRPKGDMFEW